MNEKTGRPRLVLLAMVVVFAAPFAGAWLIYNFTDIGRDSASNSYGELVQPPVKVRDQALKDPGGGVDQPLHGKWSLVYFMPPDCGRGCAGRLAAMREVRAMLVRDAARLQLVAATAPGRDVSLPATVAAAVRKGILLLDGFDPAAYPAAAADGSLFLIDPLGNLMMRYPPGSTSEGIAGDLKRLLRYSRIG